MLLHVCMSLCVHMCVSPRRPQVTPCTRKGTRTSCRPADLLAPLFRFLGCKVSPGACMMVLCMRCQPPPNMQRPLLLPNPRLPNTSLHPSGTSTSPTSVYQVRNYGDQGSHPTATAVPSPELLQRRTHGLGNSTGRERSKGGSVAVPPPLLPGVGRAGWGMVRQQGVPRTGESHRALVYAESARTLIVLVLVLKCTGRRFTLPPVKLSVEAQPEQRPVLGVPSRRDLSLSRPQQFIPHSRDPGPFHRHNRCVCRVVVFLPL